MKSYLRLAEVIVILSILISGFVLFAYERKNNDPDYQKNWVAFYFTDSNLPGNGAALENHLGIDTQFTFCLVPDNNDLMEPTDLSCSLETAQQSVTKNVTAGKSEQWSYSLPEKKGKYWIVTEYKDKDSVLKTKDLSFEIN